MPLLLTKLITISVFDDGTTAMHVATLGAVIRRGLEVPNGEGRMSPEAAIERVRAELPSVP